MALALILVDGGIGLPFDGGSDDPLWVMWSPQRLVVVLMMPGSFDDLISLPFYRIPLVTCPSRVTVNGCIIRVKKPDVTPPP